jgi:hypothetical protein
LFHSEQLPVVPKNNRIKTKRQKRFYSEERQFEPFSVIELTGTQRKHGINKVEIMTVQEVLSLRGFQVSDIELGI